MTPPQFLSAAELADYDLESTGLADRSRALIRHQQATWPMLQKGASTLDSVKVRIFDFDGFAMKVQFNPGRIVSSSAKVDTKSIAERKCFLCLENLPAEQRGIETGDYAILCNPFPIFPEHFTIPHKEHIPQRIASSYRAMLDITRQIGTYYSLFYNGPKCGASAPDHLHFQAGDYGFMSIDTTWESLVNSHGTWIHKSEAGRLAGVDDGLRRFFVIESNDKAWSIDQFNRIYEAFDAQNPEPGEEPMLNVLTALERGKWRTIMFLRRKHRPEQFFLEGDDRILFSPASVDFGGVCITPVEKDFNTMTKALLTDMFGQLSITPEVYQHIAKSL